MSIEFFIFYFLIINYVAAMVSIFDKRQAKLHNHRVSEMNLFLLSIAGGALSMYIVLRCIRHKTRKKRFMIGLPIVFTLQFLIIFLLLFLDLMK